MCELRENWSLFLVINKSIENGSSTICASSRKRGKFFAENCNIKTNSTPTTQTADHNLAANSSYFFLLFFLNSATK
jgi:hypothetical protein